jgi:hypothetical protein
MVGLSPGVMCKMTIKHCTGVCWLFYTTQGSISWSQLSVGQTFGDIFQWEIALRKFVACMVCCQNPIGAQNVYFVFVCKGYMCLIVLLNLPCCCLTFIHAVFCEIHPGLN